jgi:hypothetical protein
VAKLRATQLAKDFNITFDELMTFATHLLKEENITGRGKNTWIDEMGQETLEANIPIKNVETSVYRGRVRNMCPNPKFMMVHIPEKFGVVKVRLNRIQVGGDYKGRFVDIKQIDDETYETVKPKIY